MPTPTFSSTNVDDTTIDHHCGHHRHMNTGHCQRKVSSLDGGGQNSWTIFCTCYYSHSLAWLSYQSCSVPTFCIWLNNKQVGVGCRESDSVMTVLGTGRNGVNVHFNLIMIIKRGFLQKSSMFHCIQPCVVCGAICYYYVVFYWNYNFVWLTLDKRTCRWLFFSNYQWLKS